MERNRDVFLASRRRGERGTAPRATGSPFDPPRVHGYAPPRHRHVQRALVTSAPIPPPGAPELDESRAEEVIPALAEIRVGENETFESALRRFNKKIQQSGILAEARRREHYEKPSVKRKRKEAKRKKASRQQG